MAGLRFDLRDAPDGAAELRAEVRAFLAEHAENFTPEIRARSWMGFDRDFTRAVGAKGWIGMCWPREFGGGEKSFLERNIVLEEMLADYHGSHHENIEKRIARLHLTFENIHPFL